MNEEGSGNLICLGGRAGKIACYDGHRGATDPCCAQSFQLEAIDAQRSLNNERNKSVYFV